MAELGIWQKVMTCAIKNEGKITMRINEKVFFIF